MVYQAGKVTIINEGKLKKLLNIFRFTILFCILSIPFIYGGNLNSRNISIQDSSQKILAQYSLFSEYYKNKDYKSAMPYGWNVLEMDPEKFNKWIYYKMEDALWYLHDSSNAAPEEIKAIEDTIIPFYNIAIKYYPKDKGYFEVRKAYVENNWLNADVDSVISDYEQAFKDNPDLSTYYYDQLGQLYKENMSGQNDYQTKAIDLYTMLSDKEPNNSTWPERLEGLVENIDQLIPILKQTWEKDKENLTKAWKYASMAMKANMYQEAIIPLEFLTKKSPEALNYWNQLASAYRKTDQLGKAENAYKKLIQLEPGNKDNYLNLGIIYSEEKQFAAARNQYEKASSVGNGWGLPIYYEGLLYEQAARNCGEFNFDAKLVYQLAVDTYRRAKNMDASASQAQDRISALSGSVPTKEDYFFRGLKSGQTVPITGSCYNWIGKSITVP